MSETGGSDGENTSARAEPDGGWVDHPADQAERHGRHQATVVVHVYESGEAVPMVEFPAESSLDVLDLQQVKQAVETAAEALAAWS